MCSDCHRPSATIILTLGVFVDQSGGTDGFFDLINLNLDRLQIIPQALHTCLARNRGRRGGTTSLVGSDVTVRHDVSTNNLRSREVYIDSEQLRCDAVETLEAMKTQEDAHKEISNIDAKGVVHRNSSLAFEIR